MPENEMNSVHNLRAPTTEVFTWERPLNNPGILALIRPSPKPFWHIGLVEEGNESDEDEDEEWGDESSTTRILKLCDVSDDEYADDDDDGKEGLVEQTDKNKGPRFRRITAIRENGASPTLAVGDFGTSYPLAINDSFTCIGNAGRDLNMCHSKRRRFGLFYNQNHLSKDYAGPETHLLPFHDLSISNMRPRNNCGLIFRTIANIPNPAVLKCKRFHVRRNAICDPFNLLMPQKTREKTEREAVQRKSSIFRRMKIYFRVKLGIEGEEDL